MTRISQACHMMSLHLTLVGEERWQSRSGKDRHFINNGTSTPAEFFFSYEKSGIYILPDVSQEVGGSLNPFPS